MVGIEAITAITPIIMAIMVTLTGMEADTTETIIGEDGMTGIDDASINCIAHPGDLREFPEAARLI
jgi:hypothetical protein